MAADKEIMRAIETLRLDRPGRVYQAAANGEGGALGTIARDMLAELAATYREEAELWSRSGAKGWKGAEAERLTVAQHVEEVVAQLDNAGGGAALSVSEPPGTGPRTRNRQCDNPAPHDRHENGVGTVTGDALYCLGVEPPRDLASLDAYIAECAAEGRGTLRMPAEGEVLGVTDEQRAAPDKAVGDIADYLSGAVDTLPGLAEALVPSSVRDAAAYCAGCNFDMHKCYGCGEPVEHGESVCSACKILHAEPQAVRGIAGTSVYRVLVTGSRTWTDVKTVDEQLGIALMTHRGRMVLVSGACPTGADKFAEEWAERNGVPVERYPADWDKNGKSAGFIRNQAMVDTRPDIVLSFNRGGSKGTEHCTAAAEAAGLKVLRFTDNPFASAEGIADAGMVLDPNYSKLPSTWESENMTADGHRTPGAALPPAPPVPLLSQHGDAGGGYDPKYVPPGGVPWTLANLLQPVAAADLPPHLSHGQIDGIGECGAKYRLGRVAGVTEIPQWALIGGSAFHAAVEEIEHLSMSGVAVENVEQGLWWTRHFAAEIEKIERSSPVPRALWRASKRGAEGETWWNANGPEMLRKYLAARPAEPTMTGASGVACIEAELEVSVQTGYGPLPFKAVLDRATLRYQDSPDNAAPIIVIRDYKTGDRMPGDADQLAEQAWTLVLHSAFPVGQVVPGAILGTYFNARKGTWTEPIDLFAEYSYDWFVYRLTSAHGQKLALTTGPTPARKTTFCGGCAVRWACPVGGPKR